MEGKLFTLSAATSTELPFILSLIREFACELGMHEHLRIDEGRLERALCGRLSTVEVFVGSQQGEPVSYARFFSDYSSFAGETGLHLEDLYVQPHVRGNGIGATMMQALARAAVNLGHQRMQWHILRSNEAAYRFYKRLGAVALSELMPMRLSNEALRRLASKSAYLHVPR